ncbi:MAG: 16S rRNA (cytidine(1402)-2'-O)-methyltransferase [Gemmatimonadaceae bacterium]
MQRGSQTGTLYLVSTPIGNLGDITVRAIDTLKKVPLILAEDTRHSRTLLRHFDVAGRVESYHEHNESETTPRVIAVLSQGEDVALISDAGTPLLSDPGHRLVRAAIDAGIRVVPIPGASALLAALVGSGLDTTNFTFLGFLARKGAERTRMLRSLSDLPHTAVLYEAPTRLSATLKDLEDAGCGDRGVVVARELTKQFEEFRRGTVRDLAQYYAMSPPKGEVVILLAGVEAKPGVTEAELEVIARELRAQGISSREVAAVLQQAHGASRNVAYRLAHDRS